MKYKYIVLTTITFTLFLIFIILINQYLKDISKDKLGSFPYKPDLSMFGEANDEYFQILEIGKNIVSFNTIEAQNKKDEPEKLPENEYIKLFIEKNSEVLKMYNSFQFGEIKLPISILNDNNAINIIISFTKLVRLKIEYDSLNGNIDTAVLESTKANKIINQLIKKLSYTKFANIAVFLKEKELSTLIQLINNEKTTSKQKLELLSLTHENITIQSVINYLYFLETYLVINELDEFKKISNKDSFFESLKYINPSYTYTYKPNKVKKEKRDFLVRVVELDQKKQLENTKDLKILQKEIEFKLDKKYKPDVVGNIYTRATKESIYFLIKKRVSIIALIKQLQIAKAILEFQEKNGSLPKNLNDLNLDSDILNNNLINKPFIYSAEIGILQRKENDKARDIFNYPNAKQLTPEEFQELKHEFKEQLILFK